jgi:hypothetical protein
MAFKLSSTMKKLSFTLTVLICISSNISIFSDSVKINKTGTVFENVKTTTEKGVVSVDFEDKTNKKFRTRDVTVTPGETVWLADKPKEEPSFFTKLFKGNPEEGEEKKETETTTAANAEEEPGEKSYLAEGIFGGVAILWLLLP